MYPMYGWPKEDEKARRWHWLDSPHTPPLFCSLRGHMLPAKETVSTGGATVCLLLCSPKHFIAYVLPQLLIFLLVSFQSLVPWSCLCVGHTEGKYMLLGMTGLKQIVFTQVCIEASKFVTTRVGRFGGINLSNAYCL